MQNKKLSGYIAKKSGSNFESQFAFMCNQDGFGVKKIPDGCKRLPGGKIVPVKSPFDFIVTSSARVFFIDTKSTESEHFNYSMLDQSQLRHLSDLKTNISVCGYAINFSGKVYFFHIETLLNCKPRTSLLLENGIFLGELKNFSLQRIIECPKLLPT